MDMIRGAGWRNPKHRQLEGRQETYKEGDLRVEMISGNCASGNGGTGHRGWYLQG